MKKYKLLSVGLGASILSIFGVMGCGPSKANQQNDYTFVQLEKGKMIEWEKSDLSSLKNYIEVNQAQYPDLTFDKLNSITPNDLAGYVGWGAEEISDSKKKIIDQVEKLIIHFMFEKNEEPVVMKEINSWILHVGSQAFTSILKDKGQGPWLANDDGGSKSYYRKKILNLQFNSDGFDFFSSRFKKPDINWLTTFKKVEPPAKGDRVFDHSFAKWNIFTEHINAASSWSIFRNYFTGEYKYKIDDVTKKAVFLEQPKGLATLDNKLELYFGDDTNYDKVNEDSNGRVTFESPSLKSKFNQAKYNKIKFKSKSGLNYAEVKDGKIKDSGKEFKAKHLFYGFLRSLYAAKSLRQEGKINGKEIKDLPKFTEQDRQEWYKQFHEKGEEAVAQPATETDKAKSLEEVLDLMDNKWDNKNVYLWDLYNVDLDKTIQENKNSAEDEFIIVYKKGGITKTHFYMITDSTIIQPYYRDDLIDWGTGTTTTAKPTARSISKFYEGEYFNGKDISNDGVLSLAPYLHTEYSVNEGEKIVLEKNLYYSDQEFVKDDKTINKIISRIKKKHTDPTNFLTTRAKNYKEEPEKSKTHEYILDEEVLTKPQTMKAHNITNLYSLIKPFKHGQHFPRIHWNFNGFKSKKSKINDLGKKMLWGQSTGIGTSTKALDAFFTGTGAKTRAAIKAAINWQTVAQNLFPRSDLIFYGSVALQQSYLASGIKDKSQYYPSYLSSLEEMQKIYDSNSASRVATYTAQKVEDAAKTLDTLASQVGATNSNPAIIPIFQAIYLENAPTSTQKSVYQNIFDRLNTLTRKVKFVPQEKFNALVDFTARARKIGDTMSLYTGYGPDYEGLGTTFDQYLRNYGAVAGVTMVKEALNLKIE